MRTKAIHIIVGVGVVIAMLIISNCALGPIEDFIAQKSIRETSSALKNYQYEIPAIFQEFFSSEKNPETLFGKPISNAYTNPNNGSLTQYFENVRLETVTDEYGRISVIASDLGSRLFDPAGKEMLIIDENCTHYGDNAYPVCHQFRSFYEKHNGQELFGMPISHVFEQNNRYYQYFTNVCLVWDSISNNVNLAPLGDTYLSSREPMRYTIIDPAYPELMIMEKTTVSDLTVVYAVEHPFIHPNWEQDVTIIVTDQNGEPIKGASITTWVILPNGHFEIYRPQDTNQDGISSFTIPALANAGVERGDLIKLRIEVNANGLFGQVIGWFRIWL